MVEKLRITKEDYILFTTLCKRRERKQIVKKEAILKHPHLYYPCFIVVLYKPAPHRGAGACKLET
jgi:hypothetical protein